MTKNLAKILAHCSEPEYKNSFARSLADIPHNLHFVKQRSDFPKIESLDYYDLLLISVDAENAEQQLNLIEEIKRKFPQLELPVIVVSESKETEILSRIEHLDVQDFIALPVEDSFFKFRIALQLKVGRAFQAGKKQRNDLEKEVASRTKKYLEAKLKAEESERLKTAFLNNLSHELRTPMNGILGFIDYLEDPDLESDQRAQFIKNIKNSSERLLSTFRDLIEISEIEAGSIKAELGPCDLREILDFTYELYAPRCEEKGLELIRESNLNEVDKMVISDSNRLKSILFHLLNNSIKFSRKGKISFGFSREGDQLKLFVKDEGAGIAPEHLEILSKKFLQIEEHLTRQHDGLGIGLSISKAFAESLGGQIEVESELGKGSTFIFSGPYKPYQEKKATLSGTRPGSIETLIKVLIVDDDPINLQLMKKILEDRAEEIIEAKNGVEALKALEERSDIDLVLMDLKMPVMDGYEAVKEIRAREQDLPVIAQTAYALAVDKERALAAGCNDYISKPLNKSLLLEKIDQQLSQQTLH